MSVGESAVSFPRVAVTCHVYVRRACASSRFAVFGSDSVWLRRGLGVSNNFIPLSMADHLQQPEPGGSVGRGPTAPAGLHPAMAANFVGVHAAEEGSWSLCGGPVPDPAFAFFGIKYDAAWQAQWGLTSMPPPGGKIRTRLKVVEICQAAGIPLPSNFRHEKPVHMGGSSCPFCQWVSMNQGTGTVVWYFHAQDSTTKREDVPGPVEKGAPPVPRPLAGAERRRHQFIHQVGKCIYGHAIAQALCRRQMDAGQSSECVRILDEPPEAWPRT